MRLIIESRYPYELWHVQPAVAPSREYFYSQVEAALKNYNPLDHSSWWVTVCGALINCAQLGEQGGTVVAHRVDEWFKSCV